MKIKSLSGPYFAGPVSGVCLLSLLTVAVICPSQGSAWVNATGGDQIAQNAQLASEGSGVWDTQNSGNGNNASNGNANNTGDLIANADNLDGGTISPLADEGIELFAATSALTVGSPSVEGSAEPGGTAYAKSNIIYSASDISKWELRTSYASGYSALAYEGTGGTAIGGAGGKSTLSDNTWGYAWTDSTDAASAGQTYNTMPAYGSPAIMKSGTANLNPNTTGTIHFAAKFANSATPGHYKTNVLVSLVSTPKSITYTLKFNANGGSSAPSDQTASSQESSHTFTITSSKPTGISGATFMGWADSASGDVKYQPGGTITLTSASPTKTLYAIWQTGPAVGGFGGATAMQDFSCSNAANNTSGQLYDKRDNSTYTVAKINNKCWMTQNLRITRESIKAKDSSNTTGKITSDDTNTNSDYQIPASITTAFSDATESVGGKTYYTNQQVRAATDNNYGAYYSYNVATLNKVKNESSGSAAYDICPKGWRLPTGGSSGEFQALYNNYPNVNNSTGWTTSGVNGKAGRYLNAASGASSIFFPAAGIVNTSGLVSTGSLGYYWSSTIYSAAYAYYLYFRSTYIAPADTNGRYVGFSVRCVAK